MQKGSEEKKLDQGRDECQQARVLTSCFILLSHIYIYIHMCVCVYVCVCVCVHMYKYKKYCRVQLTPKNNRGVII